MKTFKERCSAVEKIIKEYCGNLGLSTMFVSSKQFVVFQGSPNRIWGRVWMDDPDEWLNSTLLFYLRKYMNMEYFKTERIIEVPATQEIKQCPAETVNKIIKQNVELIETVGDGIKQEIKSIKKTNRKGK